MSQQFPASEVLAHWRYATVEWQDYVACESEAARQEAADEFGKGHTGCVVAVFVLTGIAVPFCKFGASVAESLIFGGIFAGSILALAFGVLWLVRRSARPQRRPEGGEVRITTGGVEVGGSWFGWGESDPAWRLGGVRRQTFHTSSGKSLELLVFRCWSRRHRGQPRRWEEYWGKTFRDKELRVLIPSGKGAEADAVVERLRPAKPAGQSSEHDFCDGVCRKCGSSRAAAERFSWECR